MTDLKFFQEFVSRFNLEDDVFIVKTFNQSIAYKILLRDTIEEEEKGFLNFSFDDKTGEFLDHKPFLSVSDKGKFDKLNNDKIVDLIKYLVDKL